MARGVTKRSGSPAPAQGPQAIAGEPDATRLQIDPEALSIIESTGHCVSPGKRDPGNNDFSPNWSGLSLEWWTELRAKSRDKYDRLIRICEEDFPTFCAVMLKVYNKAVSRIHPFIYNKSQRYAWNIMAGVIGEGKALFVQFLKSRQLGVSTLVLAKHDWHAWRERDVNTTVIAHQEKLAKTLVRTLALFYDEMPDLPEIKPRLKQMNRSAKIPKSEVHFSSRGGIEWRSQINTSVAKNVEARGEQCKHILESEYAFYPDPKALNDALMPQLPPLGSPARLLCSVIIESTPNGQNHFYDLWQLAKSGTSEWVGIFLPWFIADDMYSVEPPPDWRMSRDEKDLQKQLSTVRANDYDGKVVTRAQMYWRYKTIEAKADGIQDAEMAFDMEYPSDDETCFLLYESKSIFKDDMKYLAGCITQMEEIARKYATHNDWPIGNVIRGELEFPALGSPFMRFEAPTRHKPRFMPQANGRLWVWEPPQEGHIYVVGSDAGDLADNAVSHVACVTCGQQAAELVFHQDGVEAFADHSIALCRWYNGALWMPEVNHIGTILLKRGMMDWQYGNVAREEKWDEVALKKNKYGMMTTEQTKPVMVSNMVNMIKERFYRVASRALRSEMSTFESDGITGGGNPRFSGSGANHDDRVMSMALCLRAVRQSPKMFDEITSKRHVQIPTAVDLGLNDSPQVFDRKTQKIPEAIRMYFDDSGMNLSANPIRGVGVW